MSASGRPVTMASAPPRWVCSADRVAISPAATVTASGRGASSASVPSKSRKSAWLFVRGGSGGIGQTPGRWRPGGGVGVDGDRGSGRCRGGGGGVGGCVGVVVGGGGGGGGGGLIGGGAPAPPLPPAPGGSAPRPAGRPGPGRRPARQWRCCARI